MSCRNIPVVLILCLIFGSNIALGQGLYVTANAGYALGAGAQLIGVNQTFTGTLTSFEGVYGSLGEGFKFGASAGYMFSENLGAELGLSYWPGKTLEYTNKNGPSNWTSQWSGSGFVAVPSIVITAGTKTIKPYARFGVVLGILQTKIESIFEQLPQTSELTSEETGGLAVGYAGALGIVVPAGGIIDLFGEVALHSLNFSPSQIERTKYTVGGVDQLASLNTKVYHYKESYTSAESNSLLSVRRPFSSIGFVVGARINL